MASSVEAEVEIGASLAEVWDLYFDPRRWASWVDGFAAVESSSGYPGVGGTLTWRSTPAGRGRVSERVLAHEQRELHRVAFTDPGAEGELETRFTMLPAGGDERRTRVAQRLSYELASGGPLRRLTDLLFVRSQMRGSLQRSLTELRAEAEADAGS
jgi:uncharacterized protein YndB with AHSA1/START domain